MYANSAAENICKLSTFCCYVLEFLRKINFVIFVDLILPLSCLENEKIYVLYAKNIEMYLRDISTETFMCLINFSVCCFGKATNFSKGELLSIYDTTHIMLASRSFEFNCEIVLPVSCCEWCVKHTCTSPLCIYMML